MWIPSLGCKDSPGIGNGNPLQYSCLENPMGRGALRVTVYGFAKNRTQVSTYPLLNNEWMSSELDSDFQVKGRRRHAPECRKFQNPLFTDSCPINLSYFWDPLGAVMTSAPPSVLQRKSVNIPDPREGRVSSGFPLEVCFLFKILVPHSSSLPDGEAHGR